jgi:peroxiredoxin Q/BCP
MAQLRQDYAEFEKRQAEIVIVGPEDRSAFVGYWDKEKLPFVGLADPDHTVANRYGQEVKLLKMGRMPATMVVDKTGEVIYTHYGDSMKDIPPNRELLAVIDERNTELASAFGATTTVQQTIPQSVAGARD